MTRQSEGRPSVRGMRRTDQCYGLPDQKEHGRQGHPRTVMPSYHDFTRATPIKGEPPGQTCHRTTKLISCASTAPIPGPSHR
ncbi:hypothetical protein E2562_033511 [Oryza meyeriana var. granulata]|uniref:Uncharacterized protein n=1 Tax=Oryza meyeriana var. granulata TaxID=110450 RepID=A0A6G1ECH3_9ORYZ|nr:hypothetical protein E2562_033511 [Oryza meyeriana var. granulata]